MRVSVRILEGPLGTAPMRAAGAAGAVVRFEGVVREHEGDGRVSALDYEAYEPMASRELARLADELVERHRLLTLEVDHSRGRVPVGAVSFRLTICASHRREALDAMDAFIDRLKRDVPIWKRPVWAATNPGPAARPGPDSCARAPGLGLGGVP